MDIETTLHELKQRLETLYSEHQADHLIYTADRHTARGAQVAHRMTQRIAEIQTTHAKICEIEDPEP